MAIAYGKELSYWINDDTSQTILDGYIIYEYAKNIKHAIETVVRGQNFTIAIDGTTSPYGEYRGLALAGAGKSDVDTSIIIGDDTEAMPIDIDRAVNKLRSEYARERRRLVSNGHIGFDIDLLYTLSNMNSRSHRRDEFMDWFSECVKKLEMGGYVRISPSRVRLVSPKVVLNYHTNMTFIFDGLKIIDDIGYISEYVNKDKEMIEHREKIRQERISRLRKEHFSRIRRPEKTSLQNTRTTQSSLNDY